MGETCGMKLIMQTIPTSTQCKLCDKIDTKMRRRAAEVDRIARWQREGAKFQPSIDKAMEIIHCLDNEIYELSCERQRRQQGIGEGAPKTVTLVSSPGGVKEEKIVPELKSEEADEDLKPKFELIEKMATSCGLPITFVTAAGLATVMAIPDSGSDRNVISYDLALHLGFMPEALSGGKEQFRLLDGGTVSSEGVVRASCGFGLTYSAEARNFRCVFRVLRNVISPVIMSFNFLIQTETLTKYRNRLVQLPFDALQMPRIRALGQTRSRLECSINGNNAEVVADSGSDIDVVSRKYAVRHGWKLRPADQVVLLADGRKMECVGVCEAQLSVGKDGKLIQVDIKRQRTSSHRAQQNNTKTPIPVWEDNDAAYEGPNPSVQRVRPVIVSTFYVLDGISVDGLIGASSIESLQVFSHHADALTSEECDEVEDVGLLRISLAKRLTSLATQSTVDSRDDATSGTKLPRPNV